MRMAATDRFPGAPGASPATGETVSVMLFPRKLFFSAGPARRGLKRAAAVCALVLFTLMLSAGIGDAFVSRPAAADGAEALTREERQWLARHDGVIRIGITVIPPQVLRSDGGYEGLSIDYIKLLERRLGSRFLLVPFATWNEVITAARERRIDMIFAAQQTPERLGYLVFTGPYIELPNMIVVRKDREGGAKLGTMNGWSVATSEGSAVHEYLKKEFPGLVLRPVRDELTGLRNVSLGEADAMVVEISRASYYIEKEGILNLRVSGEAGLVYQLRFAVRKDWPELRAILDKGLSSLTAEERREINRRWIMAGEKSAFAGGAFWISLATVLGVIALAIAAIAAWNRALRRTVTERTAQLQQELAERRRAEEALQHERLLLARIAETSPVGITMVNREGLVIFANRQAENLLGLTKDEIAQRTYDAPQWRITDFDGAPFPEEKLPFRRVMAARGPVFDVRHAIEWPDGRRVRLSINGAPLLNEAGEIESVVFAMEDVTRRSQAEQALRESEQLFRALVENSPDFVARYDRDYRRIYVNPAIRKLFTSPLENVLGRTPSSQSPVHAPQIYIEHLRRVIETAAESAVEMPFRTAQGEMHWGHMRFVPEFGPDGAVATVLAIGRDINEIKENERRFRTLAENFPDFIIRFDRDGRCAYANPAVEKAFGAPADAITGKTLRELPQAGSPDQVDALTALIRRAFDEGVGNETEVRWRVAAGERVFELRQAPEKDATGNVVSVLCIAYDVTERKRAVEALQKITEELDRRVKERTAELEAKIAEIERMNRIFVGRELRMAELKNKLRKLDKNDRESTS